MQLKIDSHCFEVGQYFVVTGFSKFVLIGETTFDSLLEGVLTPFQTVHSDRDRVNQENIMAYTNEQLSTIVDALTARLAVLDRIGLTPGERGSTRPLSLPYCFGFASGCCLLSGVLFGVMSCPS